MLCSHVLRGTNFIQQFRSSISAFHGLTAPEKQRGVGRLTSSREKAPYEGLNKQIRFYSICRRDGHKWTTSHKRRDAPKKPRKLGKCKNCGMEGHCRTTCNFCRMKSEILFLFYCYEDFLVCLCEHCSALVPHFQES